MMIVNQWKVKMKVKHFEYQVTVEMKQNIHLLNCVHSVVYMRMQRTNENYTPKEKET